ncbi:MAG: hypothetical protein V1702_00380 [Candidatus Woesearchaeota archaeon]
MQKQESRSRYPPGLPPWSLEFKVEELRKLRYAQKVLQSALETAAAKGMSTEGVIKYMTSNMDLRYPNDPDHATILNLEPSRLIERAFGKMIITRNFGRALGKGLGLEDVFEGLEYER